MEEVLQQSFVTGVERVAAWADLLDSINVFPVADGDTGRNLSISLSPLRAVRKEKDKVIRQLLLAARGNSGNIASRYFSAFYAADTLSDLAAYAKEGSVRAWKAVSDPRPGTMLTIFDVLTDVLGQDDITFDRKTVDTIINRLEKAVHETNELLPKLKKAGVVDAGALGIYIFFEGFFYSLAGLAKNYRPITEVFKNRLQILSSFQENAESGYCVDFVVKAPNQSKDELEKLTQAQKSVVIIPEGDLYKIHLHTEDREKVKAQITGLGSVINWEDDNLASQVKEFMHSKDGQTLHIMTDAAGSVTRQDAKKYGFTLLNSYLTVGEKCLPETYFHPEELYSAMRQGIKVSTSQASVFERHQFYASVLDRFEKVLYLCVGSVFTGNFDVVIEWKKHNDPQNRLLVIDTGAASGRLGTIVLAAARYLAKTNDMEKTFAFAQKAVQICEEYVFLDKLQYLAAGGRLSKPSAFFGDMFKMKPVISPQPEGAKKVGVVRNQEEQLKMAQERLAMSLRNDSPALIMLEYSDNYDWVNETVKKMLEERYPQTEVILQPLSLTSGAHMGPGTWAVAFLPQMDQS
jgi:DegV family protein with EDD domain